MRPLRIIFAGTPDFTIPSLDAIGKSKHQLLAVYTQPDRPAGRGRHLQASAVKEWALTHQIPIYQPLNFKDQQAIDELAALKPDIMVVIAYGLILPTAVLAIPRLGCINVHASLLPRWRGASPIQQAIFHGDAQTGVTIMKMDAGMDTGDMLTHVTCPINTDDTSASLHHRLSELSVSPLLETLDKLASGAAVATVQDERLVTYAPKINKEDAAIDWSQSAKSIDCKIRAFTPWPIAYTQAGDLVIRIHKAQVVKETSTKPYGSIISIDKKGILVATGEHSILIKQLQFPGSKAITVTDYLNSGKQLLTIDLVLQ